MRSLMKDQCLLVKLIVRLQTDSSPAQGFAKRRGLGRRRHVSSKVLWPQDRVIKGELNVTKAKPEDQHADGLTRAIWCRRSQRCNKAAVGINANAAQTNDEHFGCGVLECNPTMGGSLRIFLQMPFVCKKSSLRNLQFMIACHRNVVRSMDFVKDVQCKVVSVSR